MTPDEESDAVIEWAWGEGIEAIDAKDKEFVEASAHLEMFLVLGDVLHMCGWTRDELAQLLDECVFNDEPADGETIH